MKLTRRSFNLPDIAFLRESGTKLYIFGGLFIFLFFFDLVAISSLLQKNVSVSFLLISFALEVLKAYVILAYLKIFQKKAFLRWHRKIKLKDEQNLQLLEDLRTTSEKYKSIFENAQDGIFQTTLDGMFIVANPAFARILGYQSVAEMMKLITDVGSQIYVHPSDRIYFKSLLETHGHGKLEYEAYRKDRSVVWLSVSARLVRNRFGKPLYYESIAEDITERRNTLRSLQESQERLSASLAASRTCTFRWNLEKNELECDENFYKLFFYPKQSHILPGDNFLSYVYPADRNRLQQSIEEIDERQNRFEIQFRIFDHRGVLHWIDCRGKLYVEERKKFKYITGAFSDITNHKEYEEILLLTLQYGKINSWIFDTDSQQLTWVGSNLNALEGLEKRISQELECKLIEAIHSMPVENFTDFAEVKNEKKPWADLELSVPLGNRDAKHFLIRARHHPLEKKIIGLTIEVTRQKKTENALRESQKNFKEMTNSVPQIVWIANAKGKIWYGNKKWLEESYDPSGNFHPTRWTQYLHPDDINYCQATWQRSVTSNSPFELEHRLYNPRLQIYRWHLTRAVPSFDASQTVSKWFGTTIDIDDQRKTIESLKETTHRLIKSNYELENFAYIASHDLKEPLRMISLFSDMLQKSSDSKLDAIQTKQVDLVIRYAKKAQSLLNDLLNYSRIKHAPNCARWVNCQKLLEEVVFDFRTKLEQLGGVIKFATSFPTVWGNADQIRQVFCSIIENSLKFRNGEPPFIVIDATPMNKEWLFSVRDNGIGIDPPYLEKVFSIFYKIHPSSEINGNGVGLAISRKIIENHKGRIWIKRNDQASGTTIYFTFPMGLESSLCSNKGYQSNGRSAETN